MDWIKYWRWTDFKSDCEAEQGWHTNSNKRRLNEVMPGDDIWLVSGRPGGDGKVEAYVLLARLHVAERTTNSPDFRYGQYRARGDPEASVDFAEGGPDMTDLLLRLGFEGDKPIKQPLKDGSAIPMSLRVMRQLTDRDAALLRDWANRLSIVRRPWRESAG